MPVEAQNSYVVFFIDARLSQLAPSGTTLAWPGPKPGEVTLLLNELIASYKFLISNLLCSTVTGPTPA